MNLLKTSLFQEANVDSDCDKEISTVTDFESQLKKIYILKTPNETPELEEVSKTNETVCWAINLIF